MATRFYLPLSGTAAVSPSYSNQAWGDTTIAARHAAVTTRINSTMTDVEFPDDGDDTDKDILVRQHVSDPIAAQTISAQTIKFQIRGAEPFSVNNLYTSIAIYVVSNDGSTVRGVILSLSRDTSELALYLENRQFSATSSQVVAQSGDRIIIETGFGGNPNNNQDHAGTLSYGDDSTTDLGENNTDTAAYNPWVEFANTLDFVGTATFAFPEVDGFVTINWNKTSLLLNSINWDVNSTGSLKILMENAGTPIIDLDITCPNTDSEAIPGTYNLENYNDPDKGERLRWPTDLVFLVSMQS
jgi:hypothetical protein